jgi:glutaredoxin
MKKNLFISAILFCIILILSLIILIKDRNIKPGYSQDNNNSKNEQPGIIFYYGDSCPHCKLVEEFVEKNKINEKIQFISKEVYNNKQNSNDLVVKAKICGLDINSIGVPFLWDGQKCLIGDQPIIDFFKQKTNGK